MHCIKERWIRDKKTRPPQCPFKQAATHHIRLGHLQSEPVPQAAVVKRIHLALGLELGPRNFDLPQYSLVILPLRGNALGAIFAHLHDQAGQDAGLMRHLRICPGETVELLDGSGQQGGNVTIGGGGGGRVGKLRMRERIHKRRKVAVGLKEARRRDLFMKVDVVFDDVRR